MAIVRCFKLVTGEEVIAYADPLGSNSLLLSKARVITLIPMNNGEYGIAFLPWSNANTDGEMQLSQTNIITEVKPSAEINAAYVRKVSSIEIVTSLAK